MQRRTPVRHGWVTGHVSQNERLSSEITIASVAPSGLARGCVTTHGWRPVGCILAPLRGWRHASNWLHSSG